MGKSKDRIPLERLDPSRWLIPTCYNSAMRVPGLVYADDELLQQMLEDNALHQVVNVASLPGIVGHSLAMPDIHWGYGFPVGAMACFAWANRQLLMHGVRQAFSRVFGRKARAREMPLVYDVCHNIAKIEEYEIDGQKREVCVHRKGATRAFPAHHPALPEKYHEVGQPVIIPGDMGRYSFVLVGAPGSMEQSFGSCCHGAGRRQSRTTAKKSLSSRDLLAQLAARGVTVRVHSKNLLAEEAPSAYKDATTPIRMSFSLAYGNEKDSRQREAVAVNVRAFNIF